MSKSILRLSLFIWLLFSVSTVAQVGVGTNTPEASAALDVSATDKGMMVPRVSLTNVTNGVAPINLPATGLLVYNINAAVIGGSGTGYYYWDSSQWVKLLTSATVDNWQLSGNSGTDSATDFIGTSDAQDLVVRTNNAERMRVESNGNIGIGTSTPAHRLHMIGDFRIQGDFFNQQTIGSSETAIQNVPFTNLAFTPLTGTTTSITITDGNGVNNSAVFISGFARVFGGALGGASSSLGGYFMVLERDTNPAFTAATIVTYTSGVCYIETPNNTTSASIGFGGSGHISYLDTALTAGITYYYRLSLVPNGVGINSGNYQVYQRSLTLLQIKQ